ncbi:unannotated protein [freshwater metagenome]|uniref:Unannotated protein n=1 Tax=freshwater metagenome TaxID=449393 RepID=A0A6J7G442_9ZZZZ
MSRVYRLGHRDGGSACRVGCATRSGRVVVLHRGAGCSTGPGGSEGRCPGRRRNSGPRVPARVHWVLGRAAGCRRDRAGPQPACRSRRAGRRRHCDDHAVADTVVGSRPRGSAPIGARQQLLLYGNGERGYGLYRRHGHSLHPHRLRHPCDRRLHRDQRRERYLRLQRPWDPRRRDRRRQDLRDRQGRDARPGARSRLRGLRHDVGCHRRYRLGGRSSHRGPRGAQHEPWLWR